MGSANTRLQLVRGLYYDLFPPVVVIIFNSSGFSLFDCMFVAFDTVGGGPRTNPWDLYYMQYLMLTQSKSKGFARAGQLLYESVVWG